MRQTQRLLVCLLLAPAIAYAQGTEADNARELAQRLLDQGSAHVDAKNHEELVATYAEDATVTLVCKDPDTGNYMIEVRSIQKNGRWSFEQMNRDMHQGLLPENGPKKIASKNTVEYASMIAPDLLVIHGKFQPYRDEAMSWPFIQVRRQHGDKWLIMSQRIFLNGERAVLWSRIQVQNKTRNAAK